MKNDGISFLVSASVLSVMLFTTAVAADENVALEEIVVTAQKRAENIQDIPKAVEVVDQKGLNEAGVTNLQDLTRLSTSIQGTTAGPFGPPAIRGISSFALSIGVQTQTGVVLDDVPQPSFSTLANELTDVERIEILPGPQSTLSGRNAAGGLINIVTHSPTQTFIGAVNVEQTNDQQSRAGGYVSGPITDNTAFSLSAFYDKWAGDVQNIGEGGKLLNGYEQRGARLKLQWHPLDDLTMTLTGFYTTADYQTLGLVGGGVYVAAAPGAGSVLLPGSTLDTLHPGAHVGPYSTQVSYPDNGDARNENKGGSLRIDLDTGIGTLSSITSRSKDNQPRSDYFLAFPVFGLNLHAHTDTDVSYTSEEVRLASNASADKLKYVAGFIYTDTTNFEPYSRPVIFPVDWDRTSDVRSAALYGQATYEVITDTSVTAGLRYQHDFQSYDWVFVDGTAPESSGSSTYNFVAGELSLQHSFTEDLKTYFTYSNAQTGRAYDLEDNQGAVSPGGLQPIASEKVQNYELGMKAQWLSRRLTTNVSLFRANYTNYQVQSFEPSADPNTIPVIRLFAIGKVRSQGAEAEADYSVSRNLRVGIATTLLDPKILDYPNAQCYTGQSAANGCVNGAQDRRGLLPGASRFRSTASINYSHSIPSMPFDGTFGAFYRYQSPVIYDLFGDPHAVQGGFGVLNLTAGIQDPSGVYSAQLFVNNATNRNYYSGLAVDTLSPAFALNASYARDSFRYFGLRFGVKF